MRTCHEEYATGPCLAMSDEEEEVVDPKESVDTKCKATKECAKLLIAYEACSERIDAKGSGQCTGQYLDYVGCVDNCAAHGLFGKLK